MQILRLLARLLDYPCDHLRQNEGEFAALVASAPDLTPGLRAQLAGALADICGADLLDAQERYGDLFDHGRSLSLHLFEHVHGDSRDRGQAMVDLMSAYEKHGFTVHAGELPDYLPLVLEYLSCRPATEAREWLAAISHITASLCARLYRRDSSYAPVLEALLQIGGANYDLAVMCADVAQEASELSPAALDREWEEAAVTFGPQDPSCQVDEPLRGNVRPRPVQWVERRANTPESPTGLMEGRVS